METAHIGAIGPCDCLNHCGDDPRIYSGQAAPCLQALMRDARRAKRTARAVDSARAERLAENIVTGWWAAARCDATPWRSVWMYCCGARIYAELIGDMDAGWVFDAAAKIALEHYR